MRPIFYQAALLLSAALVANCGGKKEAMPTDEEILNSPDGPVTQVVPDSTIYGLCGQGTSATKLKFVSDNGKILNLDLTAAKAAGLVLGDINVGDRLALVPNADSTRVERCVNITMLMGDWVHISAIDGSSEIGFRIKEGGIADGVEQTDIIYQTWRVFNNQLELHWQREGGSQNEEMGLYTMLYLSNDSLSFKDNEDVYEYTRPHPVEDMGIHAEDFGALEF